jgi:tetratricopeptide (TPR) repeat protein
MSRASLPVLSLLAAALLWALPCVLNAQDQERTGDAAVAERYAEWARTAIAEERWEEAEAALERAADYADVSSDLSYLLALARSRLGRPRRLVLDALRQGLAFKRWKVHSAAQARLLEAETLIATRSFEAALEALQEAGDDGHTLSLKARAYRGLLDGRLFIRTIQEALDRNPRSPEAPRLLFAYAAGRVPAADERELVALCLRRLPLLVEADPELAFMAAPFIRDAGEGRRYVAAYRAAGGANPAGIPAALNLGIIDEDQAMAELFREPALDRGLLEAVWNLLRTAESRSGFANALSGFSGLITEDADGDGHSESRTVYQDGLLQSYACDADQDLEPELEVFFALGLPVRAEAAAYPEEASGPEPARPERRLVALEWEQYPAALRAELDGVTYIPRPGDFLFKPLNFRELLGSSLLYPEGEFVRQISRRSLVSMALMIEQPGRTIPGSVEQTELHDGVKRRSREFLGDTLVSETEYLLGQPLSQRIDMDLDGRLETVRRFRRSDFPPDDTGELLSSESDWDGDGVYEYGETWEGDRVIRSWDMDGDGEREQSETGARIW